MHRHTSDRPLAPFAGCNVHTCKHALETFLGNNPEDFCSAVHCSLARLISTSLLTPSILKPHCASQEQAHCFPSMNNLFQMPFPTVLTTLHAPFPLLSSICPQAFEALLSFTLILSCYTISFLPLGYPSPAALPLSLFPPSLPHQPLKPVGLSALSISSWLLLQASMLRYLKMWYFPLEQIWAGGCCRGLLSREMVWRWRRCR